MRASSAPEQREQQPVEPPVEPPELPPAEPVEQQPLALPPGASTLPVASRPVPIRAWVGPLTPLVQYPAHPLPVSLATPFNPLRGGLAMLTSRGPVFLLISL